MPKQINTKFDKSALPGWAQNDVRVVEICKRDLAFRCDVARAKTAQIRKLLKREAENRFHNLFEES
mgnify:CR=1 FL=1